MTTRLLPGRPTGAALVTAVLSGGLALSSTAVAASGAGGPAVTAGTPPQRPTVTVHGRAYPAPDPFRADLPSGARVDWAYWRQRLAAKGRTRAVRRTASPSAREAVPAAVSYTEREPAGTVGANDSYASREPVDSFGVGRAFQAADISGRLSTGSLTTRVFRTREDNGSIPQAARTGIGTRLRRTRTASRIGNGPHGRHGDGHGDFDFYRLHAVAGQQLRADTRGSRLDTVLAVYGPHGRRVAFNDDAAGVTSAVSYAVRHTGYYYVAVAGFSGHNPLPRNPFRARSGRGAGDEGAYKLRISATRLDRDVYGVHLDSGDVLGGTLSGHAGEVRVVDQHRRRTVGSRQDVSAEYPVSSPLPGGGATFAYVAKQPGWYAVSAQRGRGGYRLHLETYRPGTELRPTGTVQTVFLDFDGARLNTAMFGGPGVRRLSPLRSFLGRWGLTADDESAVVHAVVAGVEENLRQTLADEGLNPRLQVRVQDSSDDPDRWGDPDVSRVVVGGSIKQSGVAAIGTSQSIDPGNYAEEETALVQLDEVSGPAGYADSFNTYLRPRSHRVAFVGRALSNLVAHEVGHLLGSFHTDNGDRAHDLMDAGTTGFGALYGVGPDGVGGTADDRDVDFGTDRYSPGEGFTGEQDTLNTSAWGLVPGAP